MKTILHFTVLTATVAVLSGCGMMYDKHGRMGMVAEPPNPAYTKPHDPAYDEERMRCSPGNHKEHRC